jgi:hypothetical protein
MDGVVLSLLFAAHLLHAERAALDGGGGPGVFGINASNQNAGKSSPGPALFRYSLTFEAPASNNSGWPRIRKAMSG